MNSNASMYQFWSEQAQFFITVQTKNEPEYEAMKLKLEQGEILATDQTVVELEQYMSGTAQLITLMLRKRKILH